MKKALRYTVLILVGILVGAALFFAVFKFTGGKMFGKTAGSTGGGIGTAAPIGANASDAELTDYAYKVLQSIKEGDYESLSHVVHPKYGLVFSPYATISLSSNKCFTADQVAKFGEDDNSYVWGVYDGNGNPIKMTPAAYFEKFVFDKDYTQASEIGVNYIVQSGNALENIRDVFPDVRFVDFHFPASGKDDSGHDWSSLRLGFEDYNGELKLTAIVHSEWTI